MKTNRTTVYLDENYKNTLERMALLTGSNNSQIIRNALDVYLMSPEYQKAKEILIAKEKYLTKDF